jgi:hypothetical protein
MGLMVAKKILALAAASILTVAPLVVRPQQAIAAAPAHANGIEFVAGIVGLDDELEKVEEWVDSMWDELSCLTDIDCLVTNLVASLMNNGFMILVGATYDDLTGQKLAAMMEGEWDMGLAFAAAGAIDSVYSDPPGLRELNLASHIKHELSDNLLNQSARAQISGGETFFGVVEPIWAAIRHLTYALFLIVTVAIGFMIMFRQKLPANVVLTFTSALPRIVIGLILITFSFSIVALTFNIVAELGTTLAISALSTEELENELKEIQAPLPSGEDAEEDTEDVYATGGIIGATFGPAASRLVGDFLVGIYAPLIDTSDATASAASALRALIISFFLIIAFTIALIAIAIQMVYRGAKLLLAAIFSPLIFLLGSLPGQEGQTGSFIRGIVADCIAFPTIALIFMITALFVRGALQLSLALPSPIQSIVLSGTTAVAAQGWFIIGALFAIVFAVMAFIIPGKVANAINPKKK